MSKRAEPDTKWIASASIFLYGREIVLGGFGEEMYGTIDDIHQHLKEHLIKIINETDAFRIKFRKVEKSAPESYEVDIESSSSSAEEE